MKSDVFYEYVANGLHQWILDQNIKKPVIFFVDGHRSHMSIELSQFCDDSSIILYALPPNATHIMQPADVAVFKPLKEYWRQAVRTWQNENLDKTLTKFDFAQVFKLALNNTNIPDYIKKGFKRCGLFPYNPEAVDYSKCIQNTLENIHQDFQNLNQVGKLSPADFESTYRVLTTLKSNLLHRADDVDWLLTELKLFEEKLLGDKTSTTDEFQNNVAEDAALGEYEVHSDGSLSLIQKNENLMQVNYPNRKTKTDI